MNHHTLLFRMAAVCLGAILLLTLLLGCADQQSQISETGDALQTESDVPTGSASASSENAQESLPGTQSSTDDAEYESLLAQADLVIPDRGQTYLQAAQEFTDRFERVKLDVSAGSRYKCTYIRTIVSEDLTITESNRKNHLYKEYGENTWAFREEIVYVPENARAATDVFAANGKPADDESLRVLFEDLPENAYCATACGYITLMGDGWHAEIVGSGF